ncbi:MAG TPA: hypothetical protein H9671_03385 [Firmicutes bacterium]|nr:hypothetical protein [Bacillota bacterium]
MTQNQKEQNQDQENKVTALPETAELTAEPIEKQPAPAAENGTESGQENAAGGCETNPAQNAESENKEKKNIFAKWTEKRLAFHVSKPAKPEKPEKPAKQARPGKMEKADKAQKPEPLAKDKSAPASTQKASGVRNSLYEIIGLVYCAFFFIGGGAGLTYGLNKQVSAGPLFGYIVAGTAFGLGISALLNAVLVLIDRYKKAQL